MVAVLLEERAVQEDQVLTPTKHRCSLLTILPTAQPLLVQVQVLTVSRCCSRDPAWAVSANQLWAVEVRTSVILTTC
jgi:hypothetical protein